MIAKTARRRTPFVFAVGVRAAAFAAVRPTVARGLALDKLGRDGENLKPPTPPSERDEIARATWWARQTGAIKSVDG